MIKLQTQIVKEVLFTTLYDSLLPLTNVYYCLGLFTTFLNSLLPSTTLYHSLFTGFGTMESTRHLSLLRSRY